MVEECVVSFMCGVDRPYCQVQARTVLSGLSRHRISALVRPVLLLLCFFGLAFWCVVVCSSGLAFRMAASAETSLLRDQSS